MRGGGEIAGELLTATVESARRLEGHYSASTRPHLARMLFDAAMTMARKASGADTATAEVAIAASMANLALEQKNILQEEARDLALRAALAVISRLLATA